MGLRWVTRLLAGVLTLTLMLSAVGCIGPQRRGGEQKQPSGSQKKEGETKSDKEGKKEEEGGKSADKEEKKEDEGGKSSGEEKGEKKSDSGSGD